MEFDQYGSAYNQIANSASSTSISVVSESNASDASTLISVYEYAAGDLEITKIEYWEMNGTVIAQQFIMHNSGSSDISNLRFQMATDPDHDLNRYGTYSTLNDVDDLDGDGVADWTVSLGPSSGIAFGFAPCDPDSATLGHSPGWDQDADLSLTDYGFGSGDYSMNWVHYEGTLAAGDTAFASNLVVFGDDLATAEALVPFMLCLALAQPAMQLHFTLAGAFRGAGDTTTPFWSAVVGNWVFRVPLALLCARVLELPLLSVWLVLILDHVSRAVWLFLGFRRGAWKRKLDPS